MSNWISRHWFPTLTVLVVAIVVIVTQSLPTLAEFPGSEAKEPRKTAIPADAQSVESGRQIVTTRCISCHSMKYLRNPSTQRPYESSLTPEQAQASFGKEPPDLSTISRARRGGAHYIFSMLTGYAPDPGNCTGSAGKNGYFPGGCIAMPDPNLTEAQALDVAAFLEEAAEPHKATRISTGIGVMLFTLVLMLLSYIVYRRIKMRVLGK